MAEYGWILERAPPIHGWTQSRPMAPDSSCYVAWTRSATRHDGSLGHRGAFAIPPCWSAEPDERPVRVRPQRNEAVGKHLECHQNIRPDSVCALLAVGYARGVLG